MANVVAFLYTTTSNPEEESLTNDVMSVHDLRTALSRKITNYNKHTKVVSDSKIIVFMFY